MVPKRGIKPAAGCLGHQDRAANHPWLEAVGERTWVAGPCIDAAELLVPWPAMASLPSKRRTQLPRIRIDFQTGRDDVSSSFPQLQARVVVNEYGSRRSDAGVLVPVDAPWYRLFACSFLASNAALRPVHQLKPRNRLSATIPDSGAAWHCA